MVEHSTQRYIVNLLKLDRQAATVCTSDEATSYEVISLTSFWIVGYAKYNTRNDGIAKRIVTRK